MEVIRCDNCGKDIDDSKQRFIVRIRQGEYVTVAGGPPDKDFCSVKCVSEFYTRAASALDAGSSKALKPWPK